MIMTTSTSSIPKPQPAIHPELLQNYSPKPKQLGQGNFGRVFEARVKSTGSPVAIKIQKNTPEARAEATFHQALNIRHAVRCRKSFMDVEGGDTSRSYIVMDLINEAAIPTAFFDPNKPNVRLTFDDIITITRQTLEVLECLADEDSIYFDLKAQNIIYQQPSRNTTVIDFGAARKINSVQSLIMTAAYIAPEYCLGAPLTPSFDLWSLGCTVYALLTRRSFLPAPNNPGQVDRQALYNIIIQAIARRIGKPTPEYLTVCPKAALYFDEKMEFKNKIDFPELKDWIETLRETGQQKGWAQEDVDGIIALLSRMLCYENRATATELLDHPIFNREIAVSFEYDPTIKCKMYIHRASSLKKPLEEITLADIPAPDLTLDFRETVSDCLHIPRDPEEKYIVILEKDGTFHNVFFELDEGNHLDVSEHQEDLNIILERDSEALPVEEEGAEPPTKKPNTQEGD